MSDYSLELAAERIVDGRTRRYFAEVLGCYNAGYYRSSVVMLWSVVVTDLLFKIEQQSGAYSDSVAAAIIAEIADKRRNNPKSPEWEAHLVSLIAQKTALLDHADQTHLTSLQNHRHLCAHPAITEVDALFAPNKETARAHIRNALDAVLTKPALMSRKIFDALMQDVEQLAPQKISTGQLERFLAAKFFSHFTPTTFLQVFRSLWRVCFKSDDERARTNRSINAQVLRLIYSRCAPDADKDIAGDPTFYSDVGLSEPQLRSLAWFLDRCAVHRYLTDSARTPLTAYASNSLEKFASCSFLSPSPADHLGEVLRRVKAEDGRLSPQTIEVLDERYPQEFLVRKIGMEGYFQSGSFAAADERFEYAVKPFLEAYTRDEFVSFLAGCATCYNHQATRRNGSSRDHGLLKKLLDSRHPDIDQSLYPEFVRSL